MKITRRTFLKFLAGGAFGLLLSPLPWKGLSKISALTQPGPVPLPKGKQEFKNTISSLCPAKTPLKLRLINGQPVQALPWPGHPLGGQGLSALAAAEVQNLFRPSRLKQPLARDNNGLLVPISWENANNLLVEQLLKASASSKFTNPLSPANPASLTCVVGDETSIGSLVLSEFLQALGSSDFYTMPCHASGVKTAWQLIGGTGQPGYDLENSDYVLSVGADLLESWGPVLRNRRVFFDTVFAESDLPDAAAEAESKRKSKYVYCGPVQNATALACEQWLVVKPGMEEFFLIALAGIVIQEMPRSTKEEMSKYSDFSAFQKFASSFSAQEICPYLGISEAKMQKLARELILAKRPVVITASSLGQNASLQLNLLGLVLNMLLNNINQPGGLSVLPELADLLDLNRLSGQNLDFSAYLHKLQLGEKELPKLLIISDCNPLYDLPAYIFDHTQPDGAGDNAEWRDIFRKIPFKIAFSSFMHETAAECDLVLPVPTGLERWEHVYTPFGCGEVIYSICPPAVEPPKGVKNILSILGEVRRLAGSSFSQNKVCLERDYFEQACHKLGTSCKELESKGFFCSSLQESSQKLHLRPDLLIQLLCDKKNVIEAKTKSVNFALLPVNLVLLPLLRLDLSNANFGLSVYQGFSSGPTPFNRGKQDKATALINPVTAELLGLNSGQDVRICRADMTKVGFPAQVCISNRVPDGGIGLWAGCGHASTDQFSAGKGQNIMPLFSMHKQMAGGLVFSQASPLIIEK